jgi:hypothetical protein
LTVIVVCSTGMIVLFNKTNSGCPVKVAAVWFCIELVLVFEDVLFCAYTDVLIAIVCKTKPADIKTI